MLRWSDIIWAFWGFNCASNFAFFRPFLIGILFWKGISKVPRCNGLKILVPKHLWKSKIGPLQLILATNRYVSFFLGHPVVLLAAQILIVVLVLLVVLIIIVVLLVVLIVTYSANTTVIAWITSSPVQTEVNILYLLKGKCACATTYRRYSLLFKPSWHCVSYCRMAQFCLPHPVSLNHSVYVAKIYAHTCTSVWQDF